MKHTSFFLLCSILLLGSACEKALDQLQDEALDGLQFEVSTGVLHQPLTLQVLDEITGKPAEGVNLELVSSDFSKVYTNSGSKTLQIKGGLLTLGTLKREAPTQSAPRKVRFRVKAEGYFAIEEEYLLSDTLNELATVWLRPMKASVHIGVVESLLAATRNEGMDLFTQNLMGSLRIDPNVTFRKNHQKLNGPAEVKLVVMPGTTSNKNHLESALIRAAFRKSDGNLGKLNLNPVSLFDFTAKASGQIADQLSFPAVLSLPIEPSLYNPLTQNRIKNGDLIPAFWQMPGEEIWQAKGFATVSNRNGKLEAIMPVAATGRWVLGFMELWPEEKIPELCQVFIQVEANIPDTIKGVYFRGETPIRYQYTRKASLNFMQVYPSCRLGQGFDMDALVRSAKNLTRNYYIEQDSTVFANVSFEPKVSVFVIQPLPICTEYNYTEKANIPIAINADEATEGWLYYQIGSSSGYRFMRLIKGINNLQVAYPRNPLFTPGGFYGNQAQFTFFYEEGCQLRSSTRSFPACEVLTQGALLRVRPTSSMALSTSSLSIDAACGGSFQPAIRPTLPIFYRNNCPNGIDMPYKKLTELNAGTDLSNLPLRLGERYDFKIQYGDELQEIRGVRLSADSIALGKFYSLSKNGRIRVHLGQINLPEGICNLVK